VPGAPGREVPWRAFPGQLPRGARCRERDASEEFRAGISPDGVGSRLRGTCLEGVRQAIRDEKGRRERERLLSLEENKAVVARWFTEFWARVQPGRHRRARRPGIRFEYSLHAPLRGADAVRAFAQKFRAAFPDLNFWGTAGLIAEGDYVVGRWEGGGAQTGTRSTTCRTARCRPVPARGCGSPAPRS
jgi:SnoaL-like polyketide cyclase